MMPVDAPLNAISVDVEDYFQPEAFARDVPREDWPSYPSRVVDNTHRILDVFARHGVRGTFFVLGWVADRFPALVTDIRAAGHELGCHSYWHRPIYSLTPEEFEADTRRAKAAIEAAAGESIFCYRAPTFSITKRSLWALDVLAACGFRSDSSIYPIYHDHYGIVGSPVRPYAIQCASAVIDEFPMSTFRALNYDVPVGGGGYLRMLPLWFNVYGMRRIIARGDPAMVYLHPWEVDPDQPRIRTRLKSRLRHYTNLRGMMRNLEALLQRFRFGTMSETLAQRAK
ncbi:MAG TPA: XrtA system polysaccharide deacetylase, partial [Candidatus Eremiobacteraceae bacterium]